ncbi:hypothetical protein [Sediminispirochaeta bajacaliforniensis]|uniref:hypothetical protein n=1 Tax=Sediminispirochaeta bajacaliforniensis TaxID=148 RepID=UPI000373A7A0|nr:hypothetical protein [Sediminispirochaeta bajacaliforniensis]
MERKDIWVERFRECEKVNRNSLVKLPEVLKPSQPFSISIEYPSGHKINIPANYNSDTLWRLVADLDGVLP